MYIELITKYTNGVGCEIHFTSGPVLVAWAVKAMPLVVVPPSNTHNP